MAINIIAIGSAFASQHGVQLGSVSRGQLQNAQRQFAKTGDLATARSAIVQVTKNAGYHPNAADIRVLENMLKRV